MSKRRNPQAPRKPTPPARPARPHWAFDAGVPTNEWFAGESLYENWHLQDAVARFVYWLEDDRFLTWEAVVCQEQGLPLTALQEEAAGGLLNFNDDDLEGDDRVSYINDIPRPSKPWDVILNQFVPHLLIEPFRTAESHWQVRHEGFGQIMDALRKHGQGLSLPPGIAAPEEVIPAELRHKLWLQVCFDDLSGLGCWPETNLMKEPDRIESFIDHLREHKQSVRFLGLTLESLLNRVILPQVDRPIFVEMMQKQLVMRSTDELIADHL